ncbi:MAG TPA: pyruvate, phosphate dikinase [Egibacteraceae bacterium]|nr:pyruvate, phosphate dikinase [Egibacteraceae bacterium]
MDTTTGRRRYVYAFAEGSKDQKELLGGKGANLCEMTRLGLPVPPGFIISTDACRDYLANGETLPEGLWGTVLEHLQDLEGQSGRSFGGDPPLLISVRSGAAFSMPGMMDTILNVGLNDTTVEHLARDSGDARFAWDAYRRLLQLFGKVVMGVRGGHFEDALSKAVADAGADDELGLTGDGLRGVVAEFKTIIRRETGQDFPQEPRRQLRQAVEAVFRSWNGRRARDYRRHEGIPDDLGTAVNVQAMVFGNLGDDSATGVAFTRNPSTGEPKPYGDWLAGAQGEDVVAGIRITRNLDDLGQAFADCHDGLMAVMRRLERHYRDMCDIEFTIERGRLYLLQTRVGKRTAAAAVRMAVDMANEGLIDEREAVTRVTPAQLDMLLHPQFEQDADFDVLTTGLNASPGAATGRVRLTADDAEAAANKGERVILVRPETSPDDLHGLIAAEGVLTSSGGLVSHAAVVARGMGKPAVCGAAEVQIDLQQREFRVGDTVVREGEVISIDGTTGQVVIGEVPLRTPQPGEEFETLLSWADRFRSLKVLANADTGEDATVARNYGAEGIGLCRTEHMFLGDRLPVIQRAILAQSANEEQDALTELGQVQEHDFLDLLEAMDGLPVTVRLLDPPLHEFLPDLTELSIAEAKGELDEQGCRLLAAARHWHEANPMLGTRGCRLGILKPDLYRMQVRALMNAAVTRRRAGGRPRIEIMIPLIVTAPEFELLEGWIRDVADEVLASADVQLPYKVGTMIETPRAAITAGAIARRAEFFSFGTNDLTQMAFGFSRDDVEGRVMPRYLANNLVPVDPFQTLDADGVGRLVGMAIEQGRAVRADLQVGVCGEHGGDPASIRLCQELGLDYVSCSPYRIPIARLASAHAALRASRHAASA